MEYATYSDQVRNNLRSAGFEAVDVEGERFSDVYAKCETGLTVGILNTMVTVVNADEMRSGDLREYTDAFRDLLGDESYAKFNVGENMFGYVLFAAPNPPDELVEWSYDYNVRERNSHVFSIVYALDQDDIHTHSISRIKYRGLYKKQKRDAEALFIINEDGEGGGVIR